MALRLALSICTLQYLSGLCTHESQSFWGSSSSSESLSDTEDESGMHREGKSSGSETTEGATESGTDVVEIETDGSAGSPTS
ncbi:hypothetical protein FB45DRAFT_929731, partial [Roridomyces roridus]